MDLDAMSIEELIDLKARVKEKIAANPGIYVTVALNCNCSYYPIYTDIIRPVYEKLFAECPLDIKMHDPLLISIIQTILDCVEVKYGKPLPRLKIISIKPGHVYLDNGCDDQAVISVKGKFSPIERKHVDYEKVLFEQLEKKGYLKKEKL